MTIQKKIEILFLHTLIVDLKEFQFVFLAPRKDPSELQVGFGDHNLDSAPTPLSENEQRFQVEQIIIHPEYRL